MHLVAQGLASEGKVLQTGIGGHENVVCAIVAQSGRADPRQTLGHLAEGLLQCLQQLLLRVPV